MNNSRLTIPFTLFALAPLILCAATLSWAQDRTSQRWAVLIGVNDYANFRDLQFCADDMRDLKQQLVASGFSEERVFLLHDDAADAKYLPFKANIERQLQLVLSLAEPEDVVLVAFSGHGVHVANTSYLCSTESQMDAPDATMVSLETVYRQMVRSPAAFKLLLVDACRDDPAVAGRKTTQTAKDATDFAKSSQQPPFGMLALTSCAPGQISMEDEEVGHGVFLHFVMMGLKGEADKKPNGNQDGQVRLLELYNYARDRTKLHVARKFNEFQTPTLRGEITGDFVICDWNASARNGPVVSANPPVTDAENPFPRRIKSPDIGNDIEWLNAARPLTLEDLRGKIVLLHFFTYDSIHAQGFLEELRPLEETYRREVAVIGVHSPKYDAQRDPATLEHAIRRLDIRHPVINDARMALWKEFGIRVWPTMVMIDPEGYYCGHLAGEGHRDMLEQLIAKVATYHRSKGTLDSGVLSRALGLEHSAGLHYPQGVLADPDANRLFIADTGHHRILVTDLDGRLLEVIGAGERGARDGPFAACTFNRPLGMAIQGSQMYVADSGNHLIRRIDLRQKSVQTFAGTGVKGYRQQQGGPLLETPLNSPHDIVIESKSEKLYVSMTGRHQLWVLDPDARTAMPFAGSGRADVQNGVLDEGAFAEPAGLASNARALFTLDSAGGAVRRIGLSSGGDISTLAGPSDLPAGRALFEFGDVNGAGTKARFQHPLGLAYKRGRLFVADSLNNKLKVVDVNSGDTTTFPINTNLANPSAVTVVGDLLYIADTNHHRIHAVDLRTGAPRPFDVEGLQPPAPEASRQER